MGAPFAAASNRAYRNRIVSSTLDSGAPDRLRRLAIEAQEGAPVHTLATRRAARALRRKSAMSGSGRRPASRPLPPTTIRVSSRRGAGEVEDVEVRIDQEADVAHAEMTDGAKCGI